MIRIDDGGRVEEEDLHQTAGHIEAPPSDTLNKTERAGGFSGSYRGSSIRQQVV